VAGLYDDLALRNTESWSLTFQTDYRVKDSLPNVTFHLGNSFAGNIPVNRAGHPNNTLFFVGFEKSSGSLTSDDNTEPWGIWLNGGWFLHSRWPVSGTYVLSSPGSSSMYGMLFEVRTLQMLLAGVVASSRRFPDRMDLYEYKTIILQCRTILHGRSWLIIFMSIIPCNITFYCPWEIGWHVTSSLQWRRVFDSWCRWLRCGLLLLSASQ